MDHIDHENVVIERFSDHDVSFFDCGHDDLNEFLKEDSNIQMEIMVNVTHICLYEDQVVGYITIATDTIKTKKIGEKYQDKLEEKQIDYKFFPALKLGRFAVQEEFQKRGFGTYMLRWLIRQCLEFSENIGARFITVDAYIIALDFYKKNFFELLPGNEKTLEKYEKAKERDPINSKKMTVPLYFDLRDID